MKTWLREKHQKWVAFMQSLNPNIDAQTVRLMDELGYVSRAIHSAGEQSLEEAGISFAQYRVLMHLFFAEQMGDGGELNPSQISERQGVNRNTMSYLIRGLEEASLVERRLNAEDRRRFNISLTDNGRALVTEHARQHLETFNHCFSVLTPAELETLLQLLTKVGAHVTAVREGCPVLVDS